MNHDDIKKMQEVASRKKSLELINKRNEIISAKMEELRQQEIEQERSYLEELSKELSDEEREKIFMMFY